jgi:hypothetical protein
MQAVGTRRKRVAAAGIVQRFTSGARVGSEWWHLFRSPQLDAAVAEALKRNRRLPALILLTKPGISRHRPFAHMIDTMGTVKQAFGRVNGLRRADGQAGCQPVR